MNGLFHSDGSVPLGSTCAANQDRMASRYGSLVMLSMDLQMYTGKSGGVPEKNQGMQVDLDMVEGLQDRIIMWDNLFTP